MLAAKVMRHPCSRMIVLRSFPVFVRCFHSCYKRSATANVPCSRCCVGILSRVIAGSLRQGGLEADGFGEIQNGPKWG